jgi:hypothetical protein
MSAKTTTPLIVPPGDAAARLGTDVPGLVAIIRRGRHRWTELKPGGKPGDRGRNRWGLTEEQLRVILRALERGFPEPAPPTGSPVPSALSPDGRSRLRRGAPRVKP